MDEAKDKGLDFRFRLQDDLLDRAYNAVRGNKSIRKNWLDDDEINYLAETNQWELLDRAEIAVCWKCGGRTTYEGESKVMCWSCAS